MMQIVTISSQRQITLPERLLAEIDVEKRDKLVLRVESGTIVAEPVRSSVVEEVAGSLLNKIPAAKRGKPFKVIEQKVKDIAARELANE